MEAKAMERAREFGRSLLQKARGGNDSLEEDKERPQQRRRSWSEVVSSSPTKSDKAFTKGKAGKPSTIAEPRREQIRGTSPGMARSPERLFSAEDVAKLVELARKQLRKDKETSSGWKEVKSKEERQREKTYVKGLMEDFTRSPETEIRCWQCNKVGHISSECPKGERFFRCNSRGHKRADCPTKNRASRAEKGKAPAFKDGLDVSARQQNRGRNLWIREHTEDEGTVKVVQ